MTDIDPQPAKRKKWARTLQFYFIRLPAVFVLAPLGLVVEYALTFPWRLAVALDTLGFKKRKKP